MESRVLVVARLSRLRKDDTQTSIDRQDDAATAYAEQQGAVVVATVADSGVSGSVNPFKRPALGPYLTKPELIMSYTEIVASSLDRLGRSARDLSALRDWAEDHTKRLTVLSPRLHWPPPPEDFASPLVWDVLSRLGEIELQMIKKRYADMRQYLISSGYLVGRAPFGYQRVMIEGTKHKTLAPDPVTAPYVREMADRYLRGESLRQIVDWLEDEGIPSPQGKPRWSPHRIGRALRNPIYIGRRQDASGKTVLKVEPVMDRKVWESVQALLNKKATRKGVVPGNTALLTNVAVCAKCDGPMYRITSPSRRKDGTQKINVYYRCHGVEGRSKCQNMVRLDRLEEHVDRMMTLGPLGQLEVSETVVIKGHGYEVELAENAADIRDLDIDDPEYDTKLAALRTERKRLQALPSVPDQVEERPTGLTVAELWVLQDTQARRDYLIRAGVKIKVRSLGHGKLEAEMYGDPRRVEGAVTHRATSSL